MKEHVTKFGLIKCVLMHTINLNIGSHLSLSTASESVNSVSRWSTECCGCIFPTAPLRVRCWVGVSVQRSHLDVTSRLGTWKLKPLKCVTRAVVVRDSHWLGNHGYQLHHQNKPDASWLMPLPPQSAPTGPLHPKKTFQNSDLWRIVSIFTNLCYL